MEKKLKKRSQEHGWASSDPSLLEGDIRLCDASMKGKETMSRTLSGLVVNQEIRITKELPP